MDLFGKKTKVLQKKVEVMQDSLKDSFLKVRDDMDKSHAWINYYYQRSLHFESQFNYLNARISSLKTTDKGTYKMIHKHSQLIESLTDNLSQLADQIDAVKAGIPENSPNDELNFHIENISNEIKLLDKRIEALSFLPGRMEALKEQVEDHMSQPHPTSEFERKIDAIQERLNTMILKKSPKEKLVQKVTKNSHDYIRALVISYIKKYEKISAFQLREMVVEEQNLTSKSSFYRILEEIEQLPEITTIKEGKIKLYLAKLKKHN